MRDDLERISYECIKKWGPELQLLIVIEELSELIKAIIKKERAIGSVDDVIKEIADVEIMLIQLKTVYGISDISVEDAIKAKIERLQRYMKEY